MALRSVQTLTIAVLLGCLPRGNGFAVPRKTSLAPLHCDSGVKTSLEVTDLGTQQSNLDVPDLRVAFQRDQLEQLRLDEQLELEELRRKVPDLESRLRLSEKTLEREQKEFQRDRKGLQQLLYDQRQRHSGLMDDQSVTLEGLEAVKDELVTKIQKESARSQALSKFNGALKAQITALLRDTRVLEKRILDKAREVASLKEDGKRLERAAAETELRLEADHKIFKRQMDKNMAEKERQIRILEAKYQMSVRNMGSEIDGYKRELEDTNMVVQQLQQDKSAAEEATAQVLKDKEELISRAKETETELNGLKDRVVLLSSRAHKLEEQIEDLEGRLTDWSFLGRSFLSETGRRISKYLAKLENKSADEAWDQALIDIDRTS